VFARLGQAAPEDEAAAAAGRKSVFDRIQGTAQCPALVLLRLVKPPRFIGCHAAGPLVMSRTHAGRMRETSAGAAGAPVTLADEEENGVPEAAAPATAGALGAGAAGLGKFGLKVSPSSAVPISIDMCAPSVGMQRCAESAQAARQDNARRVLRPRRRRRTLTPRPARAQEGTQGVAELQAKLEVLQAQIERMNAEKAAAAPPAPPPASPAADPCSVAVGNVSPMAVPEVVAAHFSMRAPRAVSRMVPPCGIRDTHHAVLSCAGRGFSHTFSSQAAKTSQGALVCLCMREPVFQTRSLRTWRPVRGRESPSLP